MRSLLTLATVALLAPTSAFAAKPTYKWENAPMTDGSRAYVCIAFNKFGEYLGLAENSNCPGKNSFRWESAPMTDGTRMHLCMEFNAKGTWLGQVDMANCSPRN